MAVPFNSGGPCSADIATVRLDPSAWERAVELANHGQVAWLSDANEETYALMPAALAHAALEALEEIEDLAEIRLRRDESSVPWEQVKAELRELERQGR